jgi:hypothetical protein
MTFRTTSTTSGAPKPCNRIRITEGPLCARDCQDRMKVCVEGHDYGISRQLECKDLVIGGFAHPELTHMHTVISETAQKGSRVVGNSLIQNQAHGGSVKPRDCPSRCPQGSLRRMPAPA